jgi:8-amino-7-oxononanoate synthase
MSVFDRFQQKRELYASVRALGADPFAVRIERVLSPTEAIIDGRYTVLAGTNNYLGLTFDPACIEAANEATEAFGTGTTGSRIANGSYSTHQDLERTLADFYGRQHAMVFTTGYQANLGVISTIAGQDDILFLDADCHASIYDASRLGQATVMRFRHNDPADLDRRLQRLADKPGNRIIVTEGIYSMLGDQAPLAELVDVKRRHGAYLVLDEAHSMGVLGATGRGLAEAAGVESDVDFIVGTFSKSLGAIGGFCVSDAPDFDIMRVVSRPYIFTASLPPAITASVTAALRTVAARPELRTRLWSNVNWLYDGLKHRGFELGPQKSPVVAVHMPDVLLGVQVWKALLEAGIYVNLALPPATPSGTALLRCSVCAAHDRDQLNKIIDTLTDVGYAFGLLSEQKTAAVA